MSANTSHRIEEQTFYVVDGQPFETAEKAREFLESKVDAFLRSLCNEFPDIRVRDCLAITEKIIERRQEFSRILDF